jgi:rod shape-determining protein MreD
LRIILFILLGAAGIILSGSVLSVVNIAGITPDLLLLTALSVVFLEKTPAGILFAGIGGIVYDIMFSYYIGFYALSSVLAVSIAYAILRRMKRVRPLILAAVGFGAFIVQQMVMAAVVAAVGYEYSFFYMLLRFILPGALITAVLMLPAYYLIRILYVKNWMTPTKSLYDDFIE